MRSTIAFIIIFAFQSSFAGDCDAPPAPMAELLQSNSSTMSIVTAQYIQKLSKLEAEQGREFKIGIIERRGTNLKNYKLLRQVDANGKPISFKQFLREITYNANPSGDFSQIFDSNDDITKEANTVIYNPELAKKYDSRILEYSHIGFIVKNHPNSKPELGAWQVVHVLDPCYRTGGPRVRDQSLGNFFADQLEDYSFKIVVPTRELQDKLEEAIMGADYKKNSRFLAERYNAATLWSQDKDGNSNSWPLEMIASVQRPYGEVTTRKQAIEVLKQTGYKPSVVLGDWKTPHASIKWIGNKFRVDMTDQPSVGKFNIGQVVTALSIEDYLKTLGQFQTEYVRKVDFLLTKPLKTK